MAKLYRSREGEATAVDTKTQLTTLGSETAPGPLLVPQGMKFITGIIVSHISNMAAATGYSGNSARTSASSRCRSGSPYPRSR